MLDKFLAHITEAVVKSFHDVDIGTQILIKSDLTITIDVDC
jgi:hypothetical protein